VASGVRQERNGLTRGVWDEVGDVAVGSSWRVNERFRKGGRAGMGPAERAGARCPVPAGDHDVVGIGGVNAVAAEG
jgi:hypothetical protein